MSDVARSAVPAGPPTPPVRAGGQLHRVALRLPAIAFVAALMASACSAAGLPTASRPAALATVRPPTAAPSLSATTHGDSLISDSASFSYDGFRDWVRVTGGALAIARVVRVGPPRWNTVDGSRPPEADIHGLAASRGEGHPVIGRLISVARVKQLSGRWVGPVDNGLYFRGGGVVGMDSYESEIQLPEFTEGQTVIAFLLPQPIEFGWDGPLPVQVGWLFPVEPSGRVETLDPSENITLDNIASYLP